MFEYDWDTFSSQEAKINTKDTDSKNTTFKRNDSQAQSETNDPISTGKSSIHSGCNSSFQEGNVLSFEYHLNIDTVCRTCLKKIDASIPNTSTIKSHYQIFDTANLAKKLTSCTSLKIEQTDKYPKYLCNSCFNKVNDFYQFQSMCVESMQQFCQMFLVPVSQITFDTEVPRIKTELDCDDPLHSEAFCDSIEDAKQSSCFVDNSNSVIEKDQLPLGDTNSLMQCQVEYRDNNSLLQPLRHALFQEKNSKKEGTIEESFQNKMDELLRRQTEIVKIVAENNVLLRESLGMSSVSSIKFPLETDDKLEELEARLKVESKAEIVGILRRITCGKIKGIDAIFGKQVVMGFNYNGDKGKKPLKFFKNFLNALYEATYEEGRTFDEFLISLRQEFKRVKNRFCKQKSRKNNR
ncbi:PREDICTED: uncharacterized protein LOC108369266 [Rhagoletis zephyria]|uniref:uncharacterized protein LOC108369266 n=1 Tax=Rhagoletis zephyria TaxID=28612 RepID=UPI0008118F47|nr:PREDICTED: uncharacterized protein LOC108369266 [Rhagoletis zephyria]